LEHGKVRVISFDCGETLFYEVEQDYVVFYKILKSLGYEFELAEVKRALDDARVWWNGEKAKTGEVWTEVSWIKLLQKNGFKSRNSRYGLNSKAAPRTLAT